MSIFDKGSRRITSFVNQHEQILVLVRWDGTTETFLVRLRSENIYTDEIKLSMESVLWNVDMREDAKQKLEKLIASLNEKLYDQ